MLDALITDFTGKLGRSEAAMATIAMRQIREGEVPRDGGTAIQEDADRPVFHGNGPDDYVCVQCGNVLAEAMDATYMTEEGARPLRALLDGQRRGDRRGATPASGSR